MKKYKFHGWETADIKDTNGLTPRDYYDILSNIWRSEERRVGKECGS